MVGIETRTLHLQECHFLECCTGFARAHLNEGRGRHAPCSGTMAAELTEEEKEVFDGCAPRPRPHTLPQILRVISRHPTDVRSRGPREIIRVWACALSGVRVRTTRLSTIHYHLKRVSSRAVLTHTNTAPPRAPPPSPPRPTFAQSGEILLRGRLVRGAVRGRGLHSSTFQLNLSAFYGIGGVRKGLCSPCQGGVGGCLVCGGCFLVTDTAQVELKSERV